jgi:AraC family transcriptional regulator
MEPAITTRGSFQVLGIQVRIEPMSADYRAIWEDQFMPHHDAVRAVARDPGYYGVYFPCDEPGKVDLVAGMAVEELEQIPDGLVVREVPAGQYAVVECEMAEIGTTWGSVYGSWLPSSERYAEDPTRACFEYFPPGVEKGEARVSIHVAVKEK